MMEENKSSENVPTAMKSSFAESLTNKYAVYGKSELRFHFENMIQSRAFCVFEKNHFSNETDINVTIDK
jgi:hypothetical protein